MSGRTDVEKELVTSLAEPALSELVKLASAHRLDGLAVSVDYDRAVLHVTAKIGSLDYTCGTSLIDIVSSSMPVRPATYVINALKEARKTKRGQVTLSVKPDVVEIGCGSCATEDVEVGIGIAQFMMRGFSYSTSNLEVSEAVVSFSYSGGSKDEIEAAFRAAKGYYKL